MNRKSVVTTLSALALVATAGLLVAGPLNPPAGPIVSTMKTLSEVEPRIAINATNTPGDGQSLHVISQPGSYYLTGNLQVPSNRHGIRITAPNVTLDLNGYAIQGLPGSFSGVNVFVNSDTIAVKNGNLSSLGGGGISSIGTASHLRLTDLSIANCTEGISIDSGLITRCHVRGSAQSGIVALASTTASVVDDCSVIGSATDGINVARGTVQQCAVSGSGNYGIAVETGSILNCSVSGGTAGIVMAVGLVEGCTVKDANTAIRCSGGSTVRNNVAARDAALPGSIGIATQNNAGSRIEGNSITNVAIGISATQANTLIVGNTFRGCFTAINSVAGCRVGTLVTGTSSPAINGNTGGGLGTSDPFANIIH